MYHYIDRKGSASNNTEDRKKRLHRFWIEELKLDELKNRNIYDLYRDYYDNEYIITYITIIKNFINTYGSISVDLLTGITKIVLDRYPDYRSIPLVRKLLFKESSNFYYYLICSLDQEIDSNYVKKLISFAK